MPTPCLIGMDDTDKAAQIRKALKLVRATGGRGTQAEADLKARLRALSNS